MADGLSTGGSYGSKPITWRSKKRVLNKATSRSGGIERAGKAYVKVKRADGTYGHDYGNGNVVWLKPKGL